MIKKLLEKSVNLALIASLFSLAASVAAYFWGALKSVYVIKQIILTAGKDPLTVVALIELMDTFLIATALLIFAIGIFELFISKLETPEWLIVQSLYDLKSKLVSVIILVMAVTFLKNLSEWKNPEGLLYSGIAIAVVISSLIAFNYFGGKE